MSRHKVYSRTSCLAYWAKLEIKLEVDQKTQRVRGRKGGGWGTPHPLTDLRAVKKATLNPKCTPDVDF